MLNLRRQLYGDAIIVHRDFTTLSKLQIEINTLHHIAHRHRKDVVATFRSTSVELKNVILHIHIVGTCIEGEGHSRVARPKSFVRTTGIARR